MTGNGSVPLWTGRVAALFTSPTTGAAMQPRGELDVLAGVGIAGDRYAAPDARAGQALTLIEEEAVEAVAGEYGIELSAADTRRNVVTRDVALNHLVGREFRVGPVLVRGVRLAEPCSHLEKLTGIRRLRLSLVHRGGLRADVLESGRIRVGDPVTPA